MYHRFFHSFKWVKGFVLRTQLVLMTLTKLLSITTKTKGLEQKGGSERRQWLSGECSSAGLTLR